MRDADAYEQARASFGSLLGAPRTIPGVAPPRSA